MYSITISHPSMIQRIVDAVFALGGDYEYLGGTRMVVMLPEGKTTSDVLAIANANA
jgi:hypothetical protein